MAGRSQRFLLHTIIALVIVLVVAALHYAVGSSFEDRTTFLPFTLAVLIAVLVAGPVPAAIATLAALGLGLAIALRYHVDLTDHLIGAVTFTITSVGIILLHHRISHLRHKVRESARLAELRRREASDISEELNLLIDGADGHAIYMLDSEGHVTIWNKGAERLTGWTEAEAIGQHVVLFYPPEAVAAGKPHNELARVAAEGRLEIEDWRQRKDGSCFLASIAVSALYDDKGKLRGFAKIVSDVTQRRAAEDALRASESHLRSILSTVPDAMVVIDEKGTILSFSATAEKLLAYTQDEVIGKNVSSLMPSPDREKHDGYIRRYLETGNRSVIGVGRSVFAQRKDGTIFPVELSVGEAVGEHERIFTGFLRDMTERRETEERLASLQAELIHVSRVSAMGAMASTLAHELNQPITAVVNYVEGVRDLLARFRPQDLPMIRDALDDAAKEALRAGNIVRHLRDFVSRGEVEKMVEPLPDIVKEAVRLALMDAREKGIEVQFDLDPAASPVLVDRVQIQQVLINLMRNAVDAMGNSLDKRLCITSRVDRANLVRVSITDTGAGVPDDMADQIFDAFVSTRSKGMGLGLSICRTIIEANGGRIWTEARPGGGAIFSFTLIHAAMESGHG